MPFLEEKQRSRGITLPPSGWVLTLLLVVYIFTGLIGHDPWKHDDAISIGIAYDIAEHGNWLALQLAGSLKTMYLWAAFFGVCACVLGLFFSFWFDVPAGAVIIISSSVIFFLALLCSPKRRRPAR